MSNRVLIRNGAREISVEELDRIAGGTATHISTFCGDPPRFPACDILTD